MMIQKAWTYFPLRTLTVSNTFYLSATQGLDREPLSYRSGDKFELN
jgi:hypothetical protein